MTVEADAGLGLELGGFSLKTLVGIQAGIDSLAKELNHIRRIQDAYQFGAKDVPFQGTVTSDASGDTCVIDLGGPTNERMWQVRRISVGGSLYTSTVAGKALVVVSGSRNTNPPTSDVADVASSLPLTAFYSTGHLIVRHPNRLFLVILTPTASTQYVAGGVATEMPDRRSPIVQAE